jgi:hypothetical protein
MLAKKTTKNQITLPKKVVARFPDVDYYDVQVKQGCIVLKPVVPDRVEKVRQKLAELGIDEKDVSDAVAWAREKTREKTD